jgi:hypothetical protein
VGDAVLAPIFNTIGFVLLCLLPLLVVWKLLSIKADQSSGELLAEFLANELVAERPVLLPAPLRKTGMRRDGCSQPSRRTRELAVHSIWGACGELNCDQNRGKLHVNVP